MVATAVPKAHVVIVGSVDGWGHVRPMCALASRIVHARPVYVSFFVTSSLLSRVQAELSRWFAPEESSTRKLIRVIALGVSNFPVPASKEMLRTQPSFDVAFAEAYADAVNGKPVVCRSTKAEASAIVPPKVVLVDIAAHEIIATTRGISKPDVKIYSFNSASATHNILWYGPKEHGGLGDMLPRAKEIMEKTGKSLYDAGSELFIRPTDRVLHTPGLPPMHHWEHLPQDTENLVRSVGGLMWYSMHQTSAACDGLILGSPEAFEPEAIAANKRWFGETSRPVWTVGPLLPLAASTHAIAGEGSLSQNAVEIKTFMDTVLVSHGKHSLIYISFGSVWWPPRLENLEAFLDVIMEKKIPFIMSHGSPFAVISDELKAKVKAYGLGLLSPWSPQQTILTHPVLGWFVTHCGQNSVLEAISSGVPIICWPFGADQAANAVILTENHKIAYELIEVRTGSGLKPRYRTGTAPIGTLDALRAEANQVLEDAFGADGATKRENVRKLKEEFYAAWAEHGPAKREIEAFLDSFGA